MSDNSTPSSPKLPAGAASAEGEGDLHWRIEVARALGLVFSNTFLYGPAHSVTKKAVTDAFNLFTETFKTIEEITFNVSEDGLLVNQEPVEQRSPLMRMFMNQVIALEIKTFAILAGIDREKFDQVMEIMNTKPEELKQRGGFAQVLAESGIEHVRMKKVTLKQVAEDEVVVSKAMADGMTQEDVEAALSFLTNVGDVGTDDRRAVAGMKAIASDTHEFADLIVGAAELQRGEADAAGPGGQGGGGAEGADPGMSELAGGFVHVVIKCLRRAYGALMEDPSAKTQKGKKELDKTLTALEGEILNKMKEVSGELSDEAAQAVNEAVEMMHDEIKIDALAAEYMRKRKAIEASERRILRFIQNKGVDKIQDSDLHERLGSGGLDEVEWHELLARSGAAGDDIGAGVIAVGHLADLLTDMEDTFVKTTRQKGDLSEEELEKLVVGVDKEVKSLVTRTHKKIQSLVDHIHEDEAAETAPGQGRRKAPALTRKKLLELLAEVVQEFCQPLSVVSCSLGTLRGGNLGEVNKQQREMIELAVNNTERLSILIDKLLEISGVPSTLSPDEAIQKSLYGDSIPGAS